MKAKIVSNTELSLKTNKGVYYIPNTIKKPRNKTIELLQDSGNNENLIVLSSVVPNRHQPVDDVVLTKLEIFVLPLRSGNSRIVYSKHTFLHYINFIITVTKINELVITFEIIKS